MTGLLVLPTKTAGSIGQVKNTLPEDVGVEVDLDYYETAAEAERQKDALIAMAARMGLGDGTTPGSFEAMKAGLEAGEGLRLMTLDGSGAYASIRIEDSFAAPTSAHGYSAGYRVGSWWVERGFGEGPGVPGPITLWECLSDTDDAAVWQVRVQPSDALPLAGVATAGTSNLASRADHIHPQASTCVEEIAIADGVTLAAGNAVALVSGRATLSDARAGSVVLGYIGQCVVGGTGDAGGTVKARVAVSGIAPASGLAAGLPVYLSASAIGAVSTTVPAGLGALWQRIGLAISATEFALQVDAPVSIDWCSPLDIPTNGIFYGRASSANLLASGRITTNGIADLFGTGRFATVDGSGSAPLLITDGGPGGDAWFFVKAARADRLRILHDAGMSGTSWSGFVLHVPSVSGQASILSKTTAGSVPRPFDFATNTNDTTVLTGEFVSSYTPRMWRADTFSRGNAVASTIASRGSVTGSGTGSAQITSTDDIVVGNNNSTTFGFDGRIASFALWNRVLTIAEQVGLAKWARREWQL